jgi:hypothetical protein
MFAWSHRQFDTYYSNPAWRSPLFWMIGTVAGLNLTVIAITFAQAHARMPGHAQTVFGALALGAVLPWICFAHPRLRRAAAGLHEGHASFLREVASLTFVLAGLAGFVVQASLHVVRAALAH